MPPRIHQLSDLVWDYKIEATVFGDYTTQVTYRSPAGPSARERRVRIEEHWVREGRIGQGAYGTIYKERCGEGPDSRVRAVKVIKKTLVDGREIDYMAELEAIAKFSHPRVGKCHQSCQQPILERM